MGVGPSFGAVAPPKNDPIARCRPRDGDCAPLRGTPLSFYDLFSKASLNAITVATQEAKAMRSGFVGTEHLLLGLLADKLLGPELEKAGLTLENVHAAIQELYGVEFTQQREDHEAPFTPRMKQVFELAKGMAFEGGPNLIEPRHLLAGINCLRNCVAVSVIKKLGKDLFQAYQESLPGPAESETQEAELSAQRIANIVDVLENWIARLKSEDPSADVPTDLTFGLVYVPANNAWAAIGPVHRLLNTQTLGAALNALDPIVSAYAAGLEASRA